MPTDTSGGTIFLVGFRVFLAFFILVKGIKVILEVDLRASRSASFNGANIVRPGDGWMGIQTKEDITLIANQFLKTIS